jgi:hypothetical protein
MKALENIDKGDAIRFREEVWYVSKKDQYDVSAIYHETQWTLTNQKKDIVYLLCAKEKINNEWQQFWIITKEIPLADVRFQNADGAWESLNPSGIPEEPPQAAQYGERQYRFHAKNIGKAESSEGGKSTKITWDYLDESQKYNLAIELWKKRKKFYPEAYSGENMAQSEFEIVPYLPLRRVFPNTALLTTVGVIMGIIGFIWIFVGPFDYFLSWSIPFFLVMRLMIYYIPLTWLISLCAAIISSIILTMYLNTFWTTGIVYLWGAVLIFRWLLSFLKRMENERLGFLSWSSILPTSWIYSFYLYFWYAPSPHEFYQLMAACVLPLMVSGTCFIIIHLTEALWLNRN